MGLAKIAANPLLINSSPPVPAENHFISHTLFPFCKASPSKAAALKVKEALELFTTRGAYASMTDGRSGALEIGMDADFIVLSEDVLEDPRKLLTAKVLEVYKSGLRIHSLEE